jgi:predicted dithiol-disulfide oxidoreductase (DUF899 family)
MAIPDLQEILDELPTHRVVSQGEWVEARRALLQREKAHRREADRLAVERRALPWVKVDKSYRFEGARGVQALADLFDGRSQLVVYHFMFDDDWESGCPSCSFIADHIDGVNLHLSHHDVTLLAVSHAPWPKLKAFRQRMGWKFDWLSSGGSDFNSDFNVSPSAEEIAADKRYYNYELQDGAGGEAHGLSVFYRNEAGEIFHTYSAYARGCDILLGAHNYLDLTPKGRAERSTMDWVRHHDRYEDGVTPSGGCCASST